jgi:hypothetical protein
MATIEDLLRAKEEEEAQLSGVPVLQAPRNALQNVAVGLNSLANKRDITTDLARLQQTERGSRAGRLEQLQGQIAEKANAQKADAVRKRSEAFRNVLKKAQIPAEQKELLDYLEPEELSGALSELTKGMQLAKQRKEAAQAEIAVTRVKGDEARKTLDVRQAQTTPVKQNELSKSRDRQAGKDYSQFISDGGFSGLDRRINTLEKTISELEQTPNATGPIRGLLPDKVRAVTNPKAAAIKDRIAGLIQESARQILGAQFTEKEGEKLVQRAYNDQLAPAENIARAKAVLQELKDKASIKARQMKHIEEKGSLEGFEIQESPSEVRRLDPKTGRVAIFDSATKKFIKYEE